MGDIRLAYQHQLVDPYSIGLDSVEAVLSHNKDDVLFKLTLNDRFQRIDETIQEMEWWACFQMQERPSHATLPDIPLPTPVPVVQTATKKSKSRAKDKGKRKQAKASRRKNRR
jgi:hypothetical protein